jgi:ABC-type multidrug transport system fused ATPase/permease subunit
VAVAKPILEYIDSIEENPKALSIQIKAFRRILKYHKPYTHILVFITALALLRSYLFLLEPLYTSQILDFVIGSNPPATSNLIPLPGLLLNILFAVVAFWIVNWFILYLNGTVAEMVLGDLRSDYYRSLQRKSFAFFDTNSVGDLTSRPTQDLQFVDMFLRTWLSVLTNLVFTMIFIFWVCFTLNTTMGLLALIPVPFILYTQTKNFLLTMPLFRKMQLTLGKIGTYVQQNILGMKNVRIFQKEDEMEKGDREIIQRFTDTAIRAGKIQAIYMPSATAILTLGITLVYVYGTNMILTLGLSLGIILLYARYILRVSFPLRDFSMWVGALSNATAGAERVFDIIDAPGDVTDKPNAKDIAIQKGEVEFRNVNFGYIESNPVLKKINFTAKPGEKIAILGATGTGKTSLVYLIPRYYEVSSGNILIDGNDIADFTVSSLRKQIGIVPQDVFLFSGTIGSNIAFGQESATIEEIKSAASMARIDDFIEALPEGYNTTVGERGVTLSGGQKQRLTIARALVTNPKILIMDDSLSFVDAKTEQSIQEAINEALKGRTCFIIAQRLSTIKNADKIMVLDKGEIIEFGTHKELMAKAQIYKRIYETQFLEKTVEDILGADNR